MEPMITSCKEAREAGEKRYFTGKPCPHGHIDHRLVSNGTCCQCNREKVGKWQAQNPDKALKNQQTWQEKNPGLAAKRSNDWFRSNRGKANANTANARAVKKSRTPHWLTKDDHWLIDEAYDLAALRTKMFGFPWHVDHVIPLQGKIVSGLHMPLNLRVIPAVDNLRKHNKYAVTL